MTEAAAAGRVRDSAGERSSPPRRLDPPKAIRLLLPVWGERYIKQFLDISLPTLLAPGNLPALAKLLPCQLVFLTSSQDADVLRRHPASRYLESICEVEIQVIDDLITGDNYSTTITLAYAQAVRAAGPAMLDTCFFFLISDYIMADGSLANVFARIAAGASGVLAGNFQIIEEDAAPTFYERFDRGEPAMVLPPRALMRWALDYLHPMTIANTMNFPLCNASHSNRLFWRVDENTLIGRFYLMHMIAIRPERTDFVIGSSCDYSFIPEMCPSDNVEVMTDSDDYLVVEMQPRQHERRFLRLGPKEPADLARTLSEWTTARHRKNVQAQLIYHSGDIPVSVPAVTKQADAFVADVNRHLTPKPQPHRGHPYWMGAMAIHDQSAEVMNLFDLLQAGGAKWAKWYLLRLRLAVFGRPPRVRVWHPRWPDYRKLAKEIRRRAGGGQRRILISSTTPALFAGWLAETIAVTSLDTRRLLSLHSTEYAPLVGQFDGCALIIGEDEIRKARTMIDHVMPLVMPNGFLLITIFNGRGIGLMQSFENEVALYSYQLSEDTSRFADVQFLSAGMLREGSVRSMSRLYGSILRSPVLYLPLAVALAPFLMAQSLLANWLALFHTTRPRRNTVCSSAHIVLRAPAGGAPMPDFGSGEDLFEHADRYQTSPRPRVERIH